MKFDEFQRTRERILRERPDVVDCAATNLYAALTSLIPAPITAPEKHVHRCHLATEWACYFGFPEDSGKRAMVSSGVRDSLSRLFEHYAEAKACLWLPTDNYPVYQDMALAAGLKPLAFPTLPTPIWPNVKPQADTEILVITNPLKPLGRWLTDEECSTLVKWLAVTTRRRLLLDAVYTFSPQLHPTTLRLLATGQTILLHSLTKGWLHPRLFGVALVPDEDVSALAPRFRAKPPPQADLSRARQLLSTFREMPGSVGKEIEAAHVRLQSHFFIRGSALSFSHTAGYFALIQESWLDLLEKHNALGIPASAFGSDREDLTIFSSLSFISKGPREQTEPVRPTDS